MREACRRVTVVVVAIGLGLALGVGSAQAVGSAGWQVAYRSHSASADPLQSVAAVSANDAWAVGTAIQLVSIQWE